MKDFSYKNSLAEFISYHEKIADRGVRISFWILLIFNVLTTFAIYNYFTPTKLSDTATISITFVWVISIGLLVMVKVSYRGGLSSGLKDYKKEIASEWSGGQFIELNRKAGNVYMFIELESFYLVLFQQKLMTFPKKSLSEIRINRIQKYVGNGANRYPLPHWRFEGKYEQFTPNVTHEIQATYYKVGKLKFDQEIIKKLLKINEFFKLGKIESGYLTFETYDTEKIRRDLES